MSPVMPLGAGEGGTELAPGGVAIELVGGPRDGQVHYLPDARFEWHFPSVTRQTAFELVCGEEAVTIRQPLTYRRRLGQARWVRDAPPLKYDLVIPAESPISWAD
jgi:hypothetical protein